MTAAEMDIIIGAEVQGAVNGLKQVNTQLLKTEQTAAQVTKKTSTNFTGLSRVIQDLPFGFIAIQNNITQLLPAAGGLGLVVSALTAAFTFAQVGLANWTRGFGASKEEVDEFAKSVSGATTETQKVSALLSVARDLTQSTATRNNALQEAIRLYPGFLQGLTLENINSQEAANATNKLADALTRKAKVQAISNLLTKANESLDKAQNARLFESLNGIESFIAKLTRGKGIIGLHAIQSDANASAKAIGEAQAEVTRLESSLNSLTQSQAQNSDFSLLNPTTAKKLKNVANSFNLINTNIKGIKPKFIDALAVETGDHMGEVQKVLDKNPLQFRFKPMEEADDTLKRIAEATGFISASFDKIFGSIGNGGNVFESITNGLKGLVIDLTKTLIKAAAVAIILNALGLGSFSIGSIFAQLAGLGSILKFATGGVVTKPTLALIGEQGPERVTPLGYEGKANNIIEGNVVFQISGQSLRGILRRADQTAFNTF